jgi:hypothetical protein
MLAGHRFNRFNLSFGIGYDFLQNVTDAYFLFTYPFMLAVPGYSVRVPQLPDSERDSNLRMLKYISERAVAHGLDFQLGLWMHGYKWLNSPNPNYTIEGLNSESHGPYCRDAPRMLLKECPAISGVTFRIHGESGVEEGSFEFWKTVFDGVATCGCRVEIDMHAKGMNPGMLEIALATGLPVKVSPKYWAEHMGMPYQQAEIRAQERPKAGKDGGALMKYSAGSRSFLRYGYGDLLPEDRKWSIMTRVWPGTQTLLLWGDPETAQTGFKTLIRNNVIVDVGNVTGLDLTLELGQLHSDRGRQHRRAHSQNRAKFHQRRGCSGRLCGPPTERWRRPQPAKLQIPDARRERKQQRQRRPAAIRPSLHGWSHGAERGSLRRRQRRSFPARSSERDVHCHHCLCRRIRTNRRRRSAL